MMRTLFAVLAASVLAIVGVGIAVFVRTRRKHAASAADAEESQLPAKIPPIAEKSGIAKMKMNESDISA
jgi:hypothetical protein